MSLTKITTFLWFDTQAEEAAKHYISIFKNSKITSIHKYGDAAQKVMPQNIPGKVMTVAFELDGHKFVGLNGGPHYTFNPAISFHVGCDTQEEVDYFWKKLGEGGDPANQRCGWLTDKFGVSWQIVPNALKEMIGDEDRGKADRATTAMLDMKKFEVAELENAYKGEQ